MVHLDNVANLALQPVAQLQLGLDDKKHITSAQGLITKSSPFLNPFLTKEN